MACISRSAGWKVVQIIRYSVYRQHGVLISVYTINSYNRSLKQDNECVIITILTGVQRCDIVTGHAVVNANVYTFYDTELYLLI